jgi:hypothetical protein
MLTTRPSKPLLSVKVARMKQDGATFKQSQWLDLS